MYIFLEEAHCLTMELDIKILYKTVIGKDIWHQDFLHYWMI